MGFCLFRLFAFLTLALAGSHAALLIPSQLYWNSVLPNTPMPKAISEVVQPDNGPAKNFVGHNEHAAEDKLLVFYYHGATDKLLKDPTQRVFFLEKDLEPGTTMKYSLRRNTTRATFMSRKTAESIPLLSSRLPEILNRLNPAGPVEADKIKETISICEIPTLKGEVRFCATSLESMVDSTTSKLGRNVQAVSTEVEKGATSLQKYTIKPGAKKLEGDSLIACHKLTYPYALFYCHGFEKTRAYVVPLEGDDGTKAEAVTVCHLDTSEWNPENYALHEVKAKPGTIPVCHFLPEGHLAWVSSQKPTGLESSGFSS